MFGPDLGLSAIALRTTEVVPLRLDFVEGRYQRLGVHSASFTEVIGVTFSRAGVGLAPRADGTLMTAAANQPRITDLGLILEPAATNLLPRSAEFDSAAWTKAFATVTANTTLAPDGTLTADTLSDTSASQYGVVSQVVAVAAATHVASIFVRKQAGNAGFQFAAAGTYGAYFDTLTGERWSIGAALSSAVAVDHSGWWRLVIVADLPAGSFGAFLYPSIGRPISVVPTLGQDVWGAQLVQAATATSPIPTTAAAATRGGEVASVIVPPNTTTWEAIYGEANTVVGGSVTPGSTFELATGRPWLNGFLKRLTMR